MKRSADEGVRFGPRLLLAAYSQGLFPMAEEDGSIHWYDPPIRAVVPLDQVRTSQRTLRYMRNTPFRCTMDECFTGVMEACADRESTWISEEMVEAYSALHRDGHAHSVEVWHRGCLVGGLYGVRIGGVFFGESMFSRMPNASKVAFHTAVEHLKVTEATLFDVQIINAHTASLGAVEIDRASFLHLLFNAIQREY
ncbi:MAG: leucyl/phenylalanyl-tRNA--protein transferase [Flavobacteriales bacterium]|nr:leucyl/phenylalanyl-tRNA--protein transferase [Flavobacteriales bacterium]